MSSKKILAEIKKSQAARQGWRCYYCDFPMWSENPVNFGREHRISLRHVPRFQCTAEHILPRSEGGTDEPENIVAACAFCNRTRHELGTVLPTILYRLFVKEKLDAGAWHPPHVRPRPEPPAVEIEPPHSSPNG